MPESFKRQIVVSVGDSQTNMLANAEIVWDPGKVTINIVAKGAAGQHLAEFLEQAEPVAVIFAAMPVQNTREKREKT